MIGRVCGSQMNRRLAVAAVIAGVAAALPVAASAQIPVSVKFFPCMYMFGGHEYVAPESTITFQAGWGARNRGLVQDFLHSVTVTASTRFDSGPATPIADTASHWGPIGPDPTTPDNSASLWAYPTGVTLGQGDSVTLTMDWTLSHGISDGFSKYQAGDLFPQLGLPSPASCTVTAAG